jgi:C4-dicarboxylate transporter DctM subunit
MFVGIPVAFSMGMGAMASFMICNSKMLAVFTQRLWGGLDSFPLMAVPLFILAGKLMEEGGISQRLVDFANIIVGRFRGGLGKASVLSSCIFAGISGSGSADTSAIGAIMIPAMARKGYEKGFIACIIASGGTIGPIIPPSLMMVIYCTATGLSIGTMFFAGFLPGILMGLSLMVIVHFYARKHPKVDEGTYGVKISMRNAFDITAKASIALLMPVVIIGGIVFGVFTATEAAAVSIFIAFVVSVFVYKKIRISDLPKIIAEAAMISSTVMMVVGMATVMSWILSVLQFPKMLVQVLTGLTSNAGVFMLLIVLLMTFLGTFMDTTAALIIFVPFLHPLCSMYDINPIHFALVCIIILHIGTITPPVGVLLYLSCGMANIKFSDALRYLIPCFIALTIVGLLVAYIPAIPLIVPRLFGLM